MITIGTLHIITATARRFAAKPPLVTACLLNYKMIDILFMRVILKIIQAAGPLLWITFS